VAVLHRAAVEFEQVAAAALDPLGQAPDALAEHLDSVLLESYLAADP
jgi:hypothetical protein